MPQVEKLLVFLASPSDVPTERRYVEEIIAELNRTVASIKGIVLQVVSWENDAFPGYGMDAQALINAQIAEMTKYSLFVGIMWNRLGTLTPRAESGTVEEFERAVEAFAQSGQPDIWFYFRQAASSMNTEEQLAQKGKVLAFKKRVQTNGMPWDYKSPSDFRDKFRNQLTLWLNARTNKTESKQKTANLDNQASTSNPIDDTDAWSEYKEDVISKGGMIYVDPWSEGHSLEELEFKKLLKGKWKESLDLMGAHQYKAIIDLWEPLYNNSFFRVDHDEWQDKPYFRCQIHSAKCQLFIAYAQLVWENNNSSAPQAFEMLKEVLTGNPYSVKGASHDRLPIDHARTQNLNYQDTLNFAVKWFKGWGGPVLEMFGISEDEVERVEQRVYQRLSEIDYLLRLRNKQQ
jgi:hypothetical protein